MAKTKVSRKELLKRPDEFLTFSSKVITFAQEHSHQFRYLGIAVIAAILIYLGINTYIKYINKKGQNAYNMAYYTIVKNIGPGKDQDNTKNPEELFKQVIDRYGISKAARLALPELAYMKFRQKQYDEAISMYQEFLDEVSDDTYKSLARMGLAACYEEKGEFEKSIHALELIISGPDDFFKEQAMLSLARVYRLSHREEKSNKILEEFINRFKNSPFLPIAKAYLKP